MKKAAKRFKINLCPTHKLLYLYYCTWSNCNKFLCAKCAEQHKKVHNTSILTFLQVAGRFSDDIQAYHRNLKMLKDSLAVLLREKASAQSQKKQVAAALKSLQEKCNVLSAPLDMLTDFIAEIAASSMARQSIPIAECILKFHNFKKTLARDIRATLSLLSLVHTSYRRQSMLWMNSEFELPDLGFASHSVYFVDPIQKTTPFTLINSTIAISKNAQMLYFNSTLLLVNAAHQELFQSTLENSLASHTATRFVPRAGLKAAVKTSYSLLTLMNHTIYLIGATCQKYHFFEDSWHFLPQLRMKQGAVVGCLVSNRYVYAFRGTGVGSVNVEVLDVLAEDQGWSIKLTKPAPDLFFPIIEKTICFQQDNEGICLLGNVIERNTRTPKERLEMSAVMLYYDKVTGKLKRVNDLLYQMKCSSNYQVKDQGNTVAFVEQLYAVRKVWVYYKQLKRLEMKFQYIQC